MVSRRCPKDLERLYLPRLEGSTMMTTTYTLTFSTFSRKIISVTFAPFVWNGIDEAQVFGRGTSTEGVEITSDADHEILVGVGDARGETCWMLPPRQVGLIVRYTDDARKIWNAMIAEGWQVAT